MASMEDCCSANYGKYLAFTQNIMEPCQTRALHRLLSFKQGSYTVFHVSFWAAIFIPPVSFWEMAVLFIPTPSTPAPSPPAVLFPFMPFFGFQFHHYPKPLRLPLKQSLQVPKAYRCFRGTWGLSCVFGTTIGDDARKMWGSTPALPLQAPVGRWLPLPSHCHQICSSIFNFLNEEHLAEYVHKTCCPADRISSTEHLLLGLDSGLLGGMHIQ